MAIKATWRVLMRGSGPTGPTGPREFPQDVFLRLSDQERIRDLATATGSATPAELVDIALSALQWVVDRKRAGKRILAIDDDVVSQGMQADELLVDLEDSDGE